MKKTETGLEGCLIIEPNVFSDTRGWFLESYSKSHFEHIGLSYNFVQDNHSFSLKKNTIRGIHFQNDPHAQTKLVRCTRGKILDIAIDLRKTSETYLKWVSIELSAENFKQLLIPKGFGHAFLTLTDNVEVQYKTDNFYDKKSEKSIRYDDPEININWGDLEFILSDKDINAPFLCEIDLNMEDFD